MYSRTRSSFALVLAAIVLFSQAAWASAPEEFSAHVSELMGEDIEHGDAQMRLLLGDRPAMLVYVKDGDELWKWTSQQFAGASTGSRIFWGGQPGIFSVVAAARVNALSACTPPNANRYGRVFIASEENDVALPGEKMWACLVFEFFNIRNYREIARLNGAAQMGSLNEKDYALQIARMEYDAAKRTKNFFDTFWSKSISGKTPRYWNEPLPTTFEEWIASFSGSQYPMKTYSPQYYALRSRKFVSPNLLGY